MCIIEVYMQQYEDFNWESTFLHHKVLLGAFTAIQGELQKQKKWGSSKCNLKQQRKWN